MAITTLDGLIAASKQIITWAKTATRTTIAAMWFSVFDLTGNPGAGTLAGTSTANGVVPTDATAGTPTINAFSGSNKGYLSRVEFGYRLRVGFCSPIFSLKRGRTHSTRIQRSRRNLHILAAFPVEPTTKGFKFGSKP